MSVLLIFALTTLAQGLVDRYVPGRMLVRLPSEYETICETDQDGYLITGIQSVDQMNRRYGVKSGKYLVPIRQMNEEYQRKSRFWKNLYIFHFEDKEADVISISEAYSQLPEVHIAEPDWVKDQRRTTPNDFKYRSQWHLEQIQADLAWDFQTGSENVVSSCFEGSDWAHPDLAPVIWNNPGEDADGDGRTIEPHYSFPDGGYVWRWDPDDLNGIDDDGNGYVDDLIGWDFIEDLGDWDVIHPEEDAEEEDMDPMDEIGYVGHGTHVSGTMVLGTNNEFGCASVSWNTRVAILRTDYVYYQDMYRDWHGAHETSATLSAFQYANMMDFDVYCLSYGGYSYSGLVSAVLREAWDSVGVVICAAAGNEDTEELSYPASYTHVLGVAASNEHDYRAEFSNYGDRIDISAPGTGIWSAMPRHNIISGDRTFPYEATDGTSMAAPVVAGAAAMLMSEYPDSSNLFTYLRIVDSAEPMPDPMFDSGMLGSGRLNLFKALYQGVYPYFELDSIAVYAEPGDEDGRINVAETGYMIASYTSDPEWQPSGDLTLRIIAHDDDIENVVGEVDLGSISPGESIDNFSVPLTFTPGETFIDGRRVVFTARLESSTGYFREDTISSMIGYPAILLYDRDGGTGAETYIAGDLERGGVQYDIYDAETYGPIDQDFLIANFRTIIFVAGSNEADPISEEEVTVFENFLAERDGRNMLLSGQYLADSPLITDLLADYFKTEHVTDAVNRFWALNIVGTPDDTVTNEAHIAAAMGTDCVGQQHSPGTCTAIDDGINCLVYQDHWTDYCGTRHEEMGMKTFFMEFSASGIHGINPAGLTRYQILYRILEWFGHPFMGVNEKIDLIPTRINHKAYPNPFNGSAKIKFELPKSGNTDVTIFDLSGRKIQTLHSGNMEKGIHTLTFTPDAQTTSGMYLYRIENSGKTEVGRILYMK